MKKRGQIQGEFFRYFLVVFVIALIIFFGIKAITKVRSASCTTSLELFKDGLKKSVESTYSEVGSINEGDFRVPCDVDKVYFVDLNKDMESVYASLNEYPLIKDAIKDNVGKNAFLVKGEKVVGSFYAGDIELEKPYFVCSDTARGNLGLYLGGKGSSTEVVNKECAFDCTFEVINITEDIAKELIEDAEEFNCEGCPKGSIDDEIDRFKETNKHVKIARRCNCGRKPGETVVEILIKPEGKLEHFKLIERIPKDYIDDLDEYIKSMEGNYTYFKIKSDPLIMWHFDEISEETIIRYTVDKEIFEYCADVFKTVGLAVNMSSERADNETELDAIKNDPLKLNLPDKPIEVKRGQTNDNVFKEPIWHFVTDPDLMYTTKAKPKEKKEEMFKYYDYFISVDNISYKGSDLCGDPTDIEKRITCIIDDKKVSCTVGSQFSGSFCMFYIKVVNPTLTSAGGTEESTDTFNIVPSNCSSKSQAECRSALSCEWCVKCDNGKWSGVPQDMCVDEGYCLYGAGTDDDRDGYSAECRDCADDTSLNPNAKDIYLGNSNNYCDCNLSDGFATGTTEICGDGKDNDCDGCINSDFECGGTEICGNGIDDDCDGNIDECALFRCMGKKYTNCVGTCDDGDCITRFGAGWSYTGKYDAGYCPIFSGKEKCECKYDQWSTTCSETPPTCPQGTSISSRSCCQLQFAYWNTSSVREGVTAKLTVEGDLSCNGQRVNFEVWRDSGDDSLMDYRWWDKEWHKITSSDERKSNIDNILFSCNTSACTATATWNATWKDEDFQSSRGPYHSSGGRVGSSRKSTPFNNPEYFINAVGPSGGGLTSKDHGNGNPEMLSVTPKPRMRKCFDGQIRNGLHWEHKCDVGDDASCVDDFGVDWYRVGNIVDDWCSRKCVKCKCAHAIWTACSTDPVCPQGKEEFDRKTCCINDNDCEPGKVCQGGSCVT